MTEEDIKNIKEAAKRHTLDDVVQMVKPTPSYVTQQRNQNGMGNSRLNGAKTDTRNIFAKD